VPGRGSQRGRWIKGFAAPAGIAIDEDREEETRADADADSRAGWGRAVLWQWRAPAEGRMRRVRERR
jgi:hypothetical protein